MKVLKNISELVTMQGVVKKDGRNLVADDLSIVKNGAMVYDSEKIHWVGESNQLPEQYQSIAAQDCSQMTITPALIDSHTHLVFAGNRADEYSRRLNGEDYQAIANAGGGILSTMKATVEEEREKLLESARKRINQIASYGVQTIEIKSGYALSFEGEEKLTEIIHSLKKEFASKEIQILNTYMAAHAVPKHYQNSHEYMKQVVLPLLESCVKKYQIDAVDIFHEKGYFNSDDCQLLFDRASELGIASKIHADELNDNEGASIAAFNQCLSADHLLAISSKGIEDLAGSSTVANLLPGTAFFLGKPLAPAAELIQAGAKIAIASDFNPGSCHDDNVLKLALMAAPSFKMNMAHLIAAITFNAASALGLKKQGALIAGYQPRFSIFECESLSQICYQWNHNFFKSSSTSFNNS